jgi:hypothetical protein
LHPGRVSFGCVTINKDNSELSPEQRAMEWTIINDVINNTTSEQVPDRRGMQKYKPFTKQTKFGTLEVIDTSIKPVATTPATTPTNTPATTTTPAATTTTTPARN